MTYAATPLKESELAIHIFKYLTAMPWTALVIATIISAFLHSAGTIGIAIALAFAGVIDLKTAMPIVLGANFGYLFQRQL